MTLTLKDVIMINVHREYKKKINMNVRDLKKWDNNKCSKIIKTNTRRNIKRNIELIKTPLNKWNKKHIRWAKMIISNIKLLKKKKFKREIKNCPLSRKTILLRNHGFNVGGKL